MAKKKAPEEGAKHKNNPNVIGLRAEVLEQPITETLEINYMPYAMSVIVSRAIPEIDGFKPSHRKLLYTMYKMGLLTGGFSFMVWPTMLADLVRPPVRRPILYMV